MLFVSLPDRLPVSSPEFWSSQLLLSTVDAESYDHIKLERLSQFYLVLALLDVAHWFLPMVLLPLLSHVRHPSQSKHAAPEMKLRPGPVKDGNRDE